MSRRPNYSACSTPGVSTNNDPKTRSINRGATAGSEADVYRYMPWRAPGTAVPADPWCVPAPPAPHPSRNAPDLQIAAGKQQQPASGRLRKCLVPACVLRVADDALLCSGVAGGDQHGVKQTAGGEYYETKHAKLGDLGSKTLKPYFSGANWKPGEIVNVSWFIQAK